MAAFIQRKRQDKQERSDNTGSTYHDSVDPASQSSNVLRRIKSSPLLRLVSPSNRKRDRDVEFPLPPNARRINTTVSYQDAIEVEKTAVTDDGVTFSSATDDWNVSRPKLQIRSPTDYASHSAEQSALRVQNDTADSNTYDVGLAITEPSPTFLGTQSRVFAEPKGTRESTQHSRPKHSRHRSNGSTGASRKQASISLPQIETVTQSTSPSWPESRPRGPREIRNTLELFGKPLHQETSGTAEPRVHAAETSDIRRTSSPLLPPETSSTDEILNGIDDTSQSESERTEIATQKQHDEDAMILWSLQKGREPRVRENFPNSICTVIDVDTLDQDNEKCQAKRSNQHEGVMEVQRSQSKSVSSSDRSSTAAEEQSSTSTARQSTSAASTTTHGSPPPQYLFDRHPKQMSETGAELSVERPLSPERSEELLTRPYTASEDERRARPVAKQRFPVVPRLPVAARPQALSTPSQLDQPVTSNPLRPIRSQTEPSGASLPKAVSPPYRAPETSTFIRDASSFRPLPPYPRGNSREKSAYIAETCSCGKVVSPVASLTIEQLRAQNAKLRAALEAVIGP